MSTLLKRIPSNIPALRRNISSSTTGTKWKSVIGLEVHAQISTESKLFSGSSTAFSSSLNSSVALFDAAIPGTLPVLNKKCVEAGIKTGLALSCKINEVSMFDRKHYFYADLPAGYQITQQRAPLAVNGELSFPVYVPGVVNKPYIKTVRLHQLQLEQDSGKSLYDNLDGRSLIDLNRAGIPLMELVFDPDLETGEEAASLVKELILILLRLDTCSCKMEEGALRVDANISLHQENEPLGTRTEIKNMGSIRSVANAITYEINRQAAVLNSGGRIVNETRSWDAVNKRTIAMRDKEVQQDYRFMPEPNLLPLRLNLSNIKSDNLISVLDMKECLPELPNATRQQLVEDFKTTMEIAIILVNEPVLLEYFFKVCGKCPNVQPKIISNFLINDLLTFCHKNNIELENCNISIEKLSEIFELLESKQINIVTARALLDILYEEPESSASEIVDSRNLRQINDAEEIDHLCKEAIESNPKAAKQYKAGKKKALLAIVGHVARTTQNRANLELVTKRIEELLK